MDPMISSLSSLDTRSETAREGKQKLEVRKKQDKQMQ